MNAMKIAFAIPDTVPQTDTDIFASVHKAIRRALADVLCLLGAADFEDAEVVARIGREVEDTLAHCENHLEHEERVVRPVCAGRLIPDAFDTGHPQHLRMIAELRSLLGALLASPTGQRSSLGHTLYLHFSVFVADCLQHMAEEERVLLPLMRHALGAEELLAIRARIIGSMTPAELTQSARKILWAANPSEQKALTLGILARAPRPQVLALLESAKPKLSQTAFANLVSIVNNAPTAAP